GVGQLDRGNQAIFEHVGEAALQHQGQGGWPQLVDQSLDHDEADEADHQGQHEQADAEVGHGVGIDEARQPDPGGDVQGHDARRHRGQQRGGAEDLDDETFTAAVADLLGARLRPQGLDALGEEEDGQQADAEHQGAEPARQIVDEVDPEEAEHAIVDQHPEPEADGQEGYQHDYPFGDA